MTVIIWIKINLMNMKQRNFRDPRSWRDASTFLCAGLFFFASLVQNLGAKDVDCDQE